MRKLPQTSKVKLGEREYQNDEITHTKGRLI